MRLAGDVFLDFFFLQAIFQSYATRERASAGVTRANDGSAMRKWMGFHRGEFTTAEKLPHANLPIFSFWAWSFAYICGFFPDYHAMRRFFALPRGLYANAVHHICLFPNKHTFNKVFAHHDFLYVDLGHPVKFNVKKCGAVHFPSKCNTISTTNPPSTHAVDLAPNADHTYHAGALGHQSDWLCWLASDGQNSKFTSHGEKRLHE